VRATGEPVVHGDIASLSPWAVDDVEAGIAFYVTAFGGRELTRQCGPCGGVTGAEVMVGEHWIALTCATPGSVSAPSISGFWRLGVVSCDLDELLARVVVAGGAVEIVTTTGAPASPVDLVVVEPTRKRWAVDQTVRPVGERGALECPDPIADLLNRAVSLDV
jgi:predicted enzyme related to lactoylglutathione lyase